MKNIILVFGLIAALWTYADADDHKERRKTIKALRLLQMSFTKSHAEAVILPISQGYCRSVHGQRLLIPKVLHTGGDLTLDKATKEKIKAYLVQESADTSSSERSRKIVSSIPSNSTPVRVADVPYIQKKHHEINKDIFKRPSIGSAGNCKACHKSAEQGIYEDDDVVIPAK